MNSRSDVETALGLMFSAKHIDLLLKHYGGATERFRQEDWEATLVKSGKFAETVLKAILVQLNQPLPVDRKFKVDKAVQVLANLGSSNDDSLRLTIPRSCVFVYDIVSNRGARHSADKFDPNKMDASIVVSVISWILSEMIRLSGQALRSGRDVMDLADEIMEKQESVFETIDGRVYVNSTRLSPRSIAILLLYDAYPGRLTRTELTGSITRHGTFSSNSISVCLTKIKNLVDEDSNGWKLREIGRKKALKILADIDKS